MKLIYQILATLLFSVLYIYAQAQDQKPDAFWRNANTTDFETIRNETEGWFKGRDKGKGTGYKQWKRWEEFNSTRLTPDRQITNHTARNQQAFEQLKKENGNELNRSTLNVWEPWGANNYGSVGLPGTGVLNCVAFHPTDANTLFVGGPATGLWKTTNHGNTWTNLTDAFLLNTGISGIIVNNINPNIIHVLTGDGDGENTYSGGIWLTVDGGINWLPTSLTWPFDQMVRGHKLAANPDNSLQMLAATNEGLFRTTDGVNFTNVLGGYFYDVVFSPASSSIVYASTKERVYRSVDNGASWTEVLFIADSERVQLAVSPQNPLAVYAIGGGYKTWSGFAGFPGFYRSIDLGTNWSTQSTTPAICSYNTGSNPLDEQVPYDIDIAVSPTDASKVFTGAINLYGSTNSAVSWSTLAMWSGSTGTTNNYVHADIHGIEYNLLNNLLYVVSDGGIYFSTDDGANFSDISTGLNINQFFDFAGTPQNNDFMLGGLYHNGTRKFTGSNIAPKIRGGDGTGCMIDYTNISTLYYSVQQGKLLRSINGGVSETEIRPSQANGPFVTNCAMSPINPNIIYTGWTKDTVFFSLDQGNNWGYSLLPGGGCEYYCDVSSISPASDGLTVYACTLDAIFKSLDAGATWSHLFSIFIFGDLYTSVRPFPDFPDLAIITQGGYANGEKVYYANGNSVSNISYNLPNVPVHCSTTIFKNGIFEIYVGTDVGVFKLNLGEESWSLFNTGMPQTIIKDLEMYPYASKMRAATFGRGVWEIDLTCHSILALTEANDPTGGFPKYQINQAGLQMYTSRKVIGPTSYVTYKAGNLVLLQSGFLATEGNKVLIGTAPCGTELEE